MSDAKIRGIVHFIDETKTYGQKGFQSSKYVRIRIWYACVKGTLLIVGDGGHLCKILVSLKQRAKKGTEKSSHFLFTAVEHDANRKM